ncbi:MAG: hypothetical protein R2762_08505 [Bryobacteraceae bacterium]
MKELNVRLGTSATIVEEFRPERNYFGAEFGNPPSAIVHLTPSARAGFHGRMHWAHQNSALSARSFFQQRCSRRGSNDYGIAGGAMRFRDGTPIAPGANRLRGNVNETLVLTADERTPLATDPAVRALITRFFAAYPLTAPNRTDINVRR